MNSSKTPAARHAGYKVILGLFFVALVMGVTAYARFVQSEKHLTAAFDRFVSTGDSLTTQECVDEVLEWSRSCSAMLSLCQDSVQRMMSGCLHGTGLVSRKEDCTAVEDIRRKTSFGFEDCSSRDLDRVRKRACADTYRAIDKHCEEIAAR